MKESVFKKLKDPDKFIFFLIFLMLIERIVMFFIIGPTGISNSDDVGYLKGGMYFAKTGILSVWIDLPTALIMPAMPVITGIACKIFGETPAYLVSLKILWIAMGLFTPYFVYKIVSIFIPKWYGILAAAIFLLPNFAWMDNVILTETPYMLFNMMCLYYTFCMGRSKDKKYFFMYILSFLAALSFRANIVSMPIFTAIYLLLKKTYSGKELFKRLLVFACASMIFFVPWTIRNYIQFDAFIPLGYGAADPTLKGTYQGVGYPLDEELDYETNVKDVLMEQYAEYFDENGELKDGDQFQYIDNMEKGIKARYRIKYWLENNPVSFLKSYLLIKPFSVLNWVWYWGPAEAEVTQILSLISKINCVLCAAAVILSLIKKKLRLPVMYLAGMYVINLYIMAMSFAIERYGAQLMPLRYILSIMGIWLIAESVKEYRVKNFKLK